MTISLCCCWCWLRFKNRIVIVKLSESKQVCGDEEIDFKRLLLVLIHSPTWPSIGCQTKHNRATKHKTTDWILIRGQKRKHWIWYIWCSPFFTSFDRSSLRYSEWPPNQLLLTLTVRLSECLNSRPRSLSTISVHLRAQLIQLDSRNMSEHAPQMSFLHFSEQRARNARLPQIKSTCLLVSAPPVRSKNHFLIASAHCWEYYYLLKILLQTKRDWKRNWKPYLTFSKVENTTKLELWASTLGFSKCNQDAE